MKFTITLPTKPYVKRFLELNYGNPVDFTKDRMLYPILRKKLEKKSHRHDKYYSRMNQIRYTDEVVLTITQDDFYRYGWELSLTDTIAFNKEMETRAKMFMYMIVSPRLGFGMDLTSAIRYFQTRYLFPEEVWPLDSIEKDCRRNLTITKNELIENISELIDKITMAKLSEKGTTLHINKKLYENT